MGGLAGLGWLLALGLALGLPTGASRGLTEAGVLLLLGGGSTVGVAIATARSLRTLQAAHEQRWQEIQADLEIHHRNSQRQQRLLAQLATLCEGLGEVPLQTELALPAELRQALATVETRLNRQQELLITQEQQQEDLQQQVIHLLADAEVASRGDLTVQAAVTGDILGAVADAFNLTLANLRELVTQVKRTVEQVGQGARDNEKFARSLSLDARKQVEDLNAALTIVQTLNGSIQRVAAGAGQAEQVAVRASQTALKGRESVEQTLDGILRIRETVTETSRKVKRLAESSQEISKIVALISQIASRTDLLALNASIELARAGEAGRGFAIVADEVRQLADRAAKSTKEIAQIVLTIQQETAQVMTAMEEGTQQVIIGTQLAEQARHALDDITQVSRHIDKMVLSITSTTVEQTEMSQRMAAVMQSVALTAQHTSQEAERVAASLQGLVMEARDLRTSVDRFRVE